MRFYFIAALMLTLLAPGVEAQVDLRLASGRVLSGELRALSRDGGLRLAPKEGPEQVLPLAGIESLAFADARVRDHGVDSAALRFDLAGGDLVYGEVIDGDFDQVHVEADPGRIDLPLDRIRSVRVLANSAGLAPDLAAPPTGW